MLDTGSSSLARLQGAYDPSGDETLQATPYAQEVIYGGGAWAGPVLRSALCFGHGHHERRIDDALFALIESEGRPFRGADGILGLAYRDLNPAYDLSTLLQQRGVEPPVNWPWPFPAGHDLDLAKFKDFLHKHPRTTLTPVFSALEEEGVLRDRFALTVGRAVVHVTEDRASPHSLAADPLNRGALVLGGGPEHQHLYHGAFHDVQVLHDLYYNANLRAVRVGGQDPIPVPPLDAGDVASRHSNALLDTGSSFLVLESSTYAAVLAALGRHDARLPDLVAQSQAALREDRGLPNHAVDPRHWPDLHLHLEAPDGRDTVLRIAASHYWPHNALHAGQTICLLMAQLPHFPKQSILGLPLFAGRYTVFDRQAGGGPGVVRLATAA
ncbi:pepsin-like aspartic protease [Arenimonas daejeonensis]|uniref:pepsin-like aspartic protease n=1 Tax=Arenimonas daejeonensis TaxID=370777 RepID=UPI001315A148|nr:pepsin-like aspartic protease [Arenimonas daejeonensis]